MDKNWSQNEWLIAQEKTDHRSLTMTFQCKNPCNLNDSQLVWDKKKKKPKKLFLNFSAEINNWILPRGYTHCPGLNSIFLHIMEKNQKPGTRSSLFSIRQREGGTALPLYKTPCLVHRWCRKRGTGAKTHLHGDISKVADSDSWRVALGTTGQNKLTQAEPFPAEIAL